MNENKKTEMVEERKAGHMSSQDANTDTTGNIDSRLVNAQGERWSNWGNGNDMINFQSDSNYTMWIWNDTDDIYIIESGIWHTSGSNLIMTPSKGKSITYRYSFGVSDGKTVLRLGDCSGHYEPYGRYKPDV